MTRTDLWVRGLCLNRHNDHWSALGLGPRACQRATRVALTRVGLGLWVEPEGGVVGGTPPAREIERGTNSTLCAKVRHLCPPPV